MSVSSNGQAPERVDQLLAVAAEWLRARQPAEAIAALREAASLAPTNATIQHDLGLASLEVGLVREAIAAFQRAVASNPRYADAYFRLGVALEKLGDRGSAVVAYDRATKLEPTLTEAWFRTGALVYTMGHREEAVGCFRRAAATGAKTKFGRLATARALLTEDHHVDAERVLRRALAIDPTDAMAQDLLGNVLAESGRFDAAHECFARAVASAPLMAGCYYDLVRCRPVTAADGDLVTRMETALGTPGLDEESRLRVHLALGKAADDLGRYDVAMQHFDAADALRPTSASFDTAAFDAEIDRVIEWCSPAMIARATELGNADPTPILIVGMPRSGTTLVEQIIASHRAVRGGGEQNFWNERGAIWHQSVRSATKTSFFGRAATDYLRLLRTIGPKGTRVTDKMPFNFLWAGLIHLTFPNAIIIHCRRAALDTALSIHQTLFHSGLAFPTGGAKLVAYFRSYERLTRHWHGVLPPDRWIDVAYEDLTLDPETAIRRIIGSCGLAWDDACLHPELNRRLVKTPSKWQTRQPIYRHSVERWRRYEPWLGPLRALLD